MGPEKIDRSKCVACREGHHLDFLGSYSSGSKSGLVKLARLPEQLLLSVNIAKKPESRLRINSPSVKRYVDVVDTL
jgi:hypothetical protein